MSVTFYGKKYVRSDDTAFTVLQVTDAHILNNEKKDAKAFKTITAMVETTKPDMIVVTGDITSEKENYTAFKTFCTFMEEFQIPWAFTYGNHEGLDIQYEPDEVLDPEKIADKQTLNDYLESLKYCIYERGDENTDGMGNYYYTVRDKNSTFNQNKEQIPCICSLFIACFIQTQNVSTAYSLLYLPLCSKAYFVSTGGLMRWRRQQ